MKIEENHSCKRSRVGNGNEDAAKLGDRENHQDEDEDDGEAKGDINNNNSSSNNNNNRAMRPWHHPSSRIFRVSRASGGKDRHSKVYTAKGLRDRRIRLSVSTAIQFYDLQDRLGYDQPSKAIEWLIKAAAPAIAELPFLNTTFPEPMNQQQVVNMEQQPMPSDSGMDPEADPSYNQQQHSSTSETSKGSVLSLSRSEIRVKARERAKVRVRDKEKDREDAHVVSHVDQSLNSQGSFTKLLTGGSSSNAAAVTAGQAGSSANFTQKQMQNLPPVTSTANYFSTQSSLFGQQLQQHHTPQPKTTHQIPTGFSSQAHFGNNSPIGMVPLIGNAGDHTVEMQQFAFLQDHFFPVAAAAAATSGGDYNLNFSISPSLTGFNRGTLQSNSPPHHHHHHHHQQQQQLSHHHHNHHQVQAQRLSSALDGPSIPFFFGAAATAAVTTPTENPYSTGFDGHLQLCDGYKHLELKGKGKS